jgi:hypothetical protein
LDRYVIPDLTIIAAGGAISQSRSTAMRKNRPTNRSARFDLPARHDAASDHSAVNFNFIPTVSEYFVFPALTSSPCDISWC